jgi:hypothetical protein
MRKGNLLPGPKSCSLRLNAPFANNKARRNQPDGLCFILDLNALFLAQEFFCLFYQEAIANKERDALV